MRLGVYNLYGLLTLLFRLHIGILEHPVSERYNRGDGIAQFMCHHAQYAVIVILAGFKFILVLAVGFKDAVHILRCPPQHGVIGLRDMEHEILVHHGAGHKLCLVDWIAYKPYESEQRKYCYHSSHYCAE